MNHLAILLVWFVAVAFWLAFVSYTKKMDNQSRWQRYGLPIGVAVLFATIAFYLTKPKQAQAVSLYLGSAALNGQIIDATYTPGSSERSSPGIFVLKGIRADQNGRYPTDPVTVVLYFSDKVICKPLVSSCHLVSGTDGFAQGFQWSGLPPISPGVSWIVPPFIGAAQGSFPNVMRARLEIYYGRSMPVRANFSVAVRNVGTY